MANWDIEVTDEFRWWYEHLPATEQIERVNAAVDQLAASGPTLGRPLVGEIDTSQERREGSIHNMKELRIGSIRILFVFDPRRTAILLLGADKAEAGWTNWYRQAIPAAERLYAEYLEELQREGVL